MCLAYKTQNLQRNHRQHTRHDVQDQSANKRVKQHLAERRRRVTEAAKRLLKEQFQLARVEVLHSIGVVAVGECSFVLRIGSQHRRAALEAMAFFIDEMKQTIPLWKTARTVDGKVLA